MNEIILTKESSAQELKAYFNAVLKLQKSNERYPVNFDEVWPLAYSRRENAVKDLNKGFIEDEDFMVFYPNRMQNTDNHLLVKNEEQLHPNMEQPSKGGAGLNKKGYRLTVSCMEYFIARKVKPVFEVYRQVFHRTAEKVRQMEIPFDEPQTRLQERMMVADWLTGFLNYSDADRLLLAKSVADPLSLHTPEYVVTDDSSHCATYLLNLHGRSITAKTFNTLAEKEGLISRVSRPSSKGVQKQYWCVTEKGKRYGKNMVHPKNPKETQPYWFDSTFTELLEVLGL